MTSNTNNNPLLPDPSSSLSKTKLKPSKEFSTRIINHHTKIRLLATTTEAQEENNTNNDNNKSKEELAWEKMKKDQGALEQYSKDMYELATKHWRHGGNENYSGDQEEQEYKYDN